MPGLLRGVARTAVIAGTASAVSGRVQRRQQGRWAEQDALVTAQAPAPAPLAPAPPPPPALAPADPTIERLRELAALRDQGILTDAEFQAQKARVLGA